MISATIFVLLVLYFGIFLLAYENEFSIKENFINSLTLSFALLVIVMVLFGVTFIIDWLVKNAP